MIYYKKRFKLLLFIVFNLYFIVGVSTNQLFAASESQPAQAPPVTPVPNEPDLPEPIVIPPLPPAQNPVIVEPVLPAPIVIPTQIPNEPNVAAEPPDRDAVNPLTEIPRDRMGDEQGDLPAIDAGDLVPTLECVWDNGNGNFTALFGYARAPISGVTIPIADPVFDNYFFPADKDRGQPTFFWGGRQIGVFSVDFDGDPLIWILNGWTKTASRFSTRCPFPKPAFPITPAPPPDILPTIGPLPTLTPRPTFTESPTPTETESPTPTETESPTPTETESPTPTETESPTPTETESPTPTETESPTPEPVQCGASSVLFYLPGVSSVGPVLPERRIPANALGFPDTSFVSLGFGGANSGFIILDFSPNLIQNIPGADFQVFESAPSDPPGEQAVVSVSQDGTVFVELGTIGEGISIVSLPDFAETVRYVQIKDTTPGGMSGDGTYADGFDLDAVVALSCISP